MDLFKSNRNEMIAYMEKKYGEEFDFYEVNTQEWNPDYIKMIVYSKKNPKDNIIVHKSRKDGTITDNYMAYLLQSEVEGLVQELATEVFGKCKAFNIPTISAFSSRLQSTTTVAEYISNLDSQIEFLIFIQDNLKDKDEKLERFRKVLADHSCALYLFSIHYARPKVFQKINKSNFPGYLSKPYSIPIGSFMLNENYELTYARWGEEDDK